MAYIIVKKDEQELAWSISWGWCDDTFDTFEEEELDTIDLPLGGEWREVPWSVG